MADQRIMRRREGEREMVIGHVWITGAFLFLSVGDLLEVS